MRKFTVWVNSTTRTGAGQIQVRAFGDSRSVEASGEEGVDSAFFTVSKGAWCPQVGDQLTVQVASVAAEPEDEPEDEQEDDRVVQGANHADLIGCASCGWFSAHTDECQRG